MSTFKKFLVSLIIIGLVATLIWALDMTDLLLGGLVLCLILFVTFGLLREATYESIRAWVEGGGVTNPLREAIREAVAEPTEE